jgi:photosystem II stability/assembly factor-like uncharacterized protein
MLETHNENINADFKKRNAALKKILTTCLKVLSTLLLVISLTFGLIYGAEWESVPIRSISQKNAGLLGGEGMQMIQSIAYAPTNPQVLYLVSDTSQVWKSIDGGKVWKMKHNGFYANGGLSVVVDPLNENIVFVAGSIGYPSNRDKFSDPLCGIFRTTDGGANWKLVKKTSYFKRDAGDNGGKYFAFAIPISEVGKGKTIYAGTYNDGLLKSTDGGDTWICCGLKGMNIYDIRTKSNNQSIVFLATTQGFYKYDDNAGTMNKIGDGLPDYPRTICINPKNPSIIYAAVGKNGVYWSTDNGMKFSKRDKGLPAGKEYTHISLSPANPDYLYVSINRSNKLNPFWSHDGGATWHAPNTLDQGELSLVGENRFFSGQIEPHPNNPDIAITAANGKARVIKTIDGGIDWFYSGEGYTGGSMRGGRSSLSFYNDTKKMIFFLIDHGPALTVDGGETFKMLDVPRIDATTTPVGAVSSLLDTDIIVTAVGGWGKQTLVLSRNDGKNWKVIPGTEDRYKFISFHPQKPNIIYAQGFISKDTGNSWKRLSQKIYAVFRSNGDIVYAIEEFGENKSVIRRSNDQGETWTTPYEVLPVKAENINEIDVDPLNPDRIYVASNSGFYIYNGKNWVEKDERSGLSKDHFGLMCFKCVTVDPKHPEVVYTGRWAPGRGQSNGVFRSTNHGKTWENITYNLGQPIRIGSVSVSPHDGTVYIGSSHGTWKLPPPY